MRVRILGNAVDKDVFFEDKLDMYGAVAINSANLEHALERAVVRFFGTQDAAARVILRDVPASKLAAYLQQLYSPTHPEAEAVASEVKNLLEKRNTYFHNPAVMFSRDGRIQSAVRTRRGKEVPVPSRHDLGQLAGEIGLASEKVDRIRPITSEGAGNT